jgi:hypothetical protein
LPGKIDLRHQTRHGGYELSRSTITVSEFVERAKCHPR